MIYDQTDFINLQKFFTSFDEWEERQQKKPLLKLQAFCESFNKLSSSPTETELVEPENMLLLNDYQNFYERFTPLYVANRQRGVTINVWEQAGLKQDEVRNTAVLAWWLDCNGSHDLGNTLLIKLLSILDQSTDFPSIDQLVNYQVAAESLPLGDLENRIDIEIQGDDFLIFVEVKINAREGDGQLQRYHDLLHEKADLYNITKRVLVYLTRYEQPKTDVDCLCISWRQLALVLERIKLPEDASHTQTLLRQFCRHIQSF